MTRNSSTFDLFGPTTKCDIRVGYISTERGYVSGVNIHQANVYAKANPGTTFIFQTRKRIQYLSINQVNALTPEDLVDGIETCTGIETGLTQNSPDIIFLGGGGVGASANLIVGTDGAILGADMVSGGFGYQYPPLVRIKDPTGIGAGPAAEAFLGEIIETVQTYPDEEDFEIYDLRSCSTNPVGFGSNFNALGQSTGVWNPYRYTNYHENSFEREVQDYQDRLAVFQNPFWTTRTEVPRSVTVNGRTSRTKYNVDHPAWGDFINAYAISPVPKSNVRGSDNANKWYSFIWEVDFPYDGEYRFRLARDNRCHFYLDNVPHTQLAQHFTTHTGTAPESDAVGPTGGHGNNVTVSAGIHTVRLDLYNSPVRQLVSRQNFTMTGGSVLQMEDWYDDDWTDLRCYANIGTFHTISGFNQQLMYGFNRCKFVVEPSNAFQPGSMRPVEFRVTTGTMFINEIEIVGLFTVRGPDINTDGVNDDSTIRTQLNRRFTREVEVNKVYDVIVRNVIGKVSPNGVLQTPPWIKLRAQNLPAPPLPTTSPTTTHLQRRTVFDTVDWIERANRRLWRTNIYTRGGFINDYGVCPFDTAIQLTDNPYAGTHRIRWRGVEFPIAGNYIFEIAVDDNADLYVGPPSNPHVHIHKDGFFPNGRSTGKTRVSRAVPAGRHTITVDLHQIPGGAFGFNSAEAAELTDGIRAINPMALAVKIETAFNEREEDIPKSWNENPMGIALAIDSPLPPIPQEPAPESGRCPPSPMWSTRFPNAETSWHPVIFRGWSPFFNKYAMSPIPPLSTRNSDGGGGIPYINKWTINAPYAGFYKLRAEVDDIGSVKVDGDTKILLDRTNPLNVVSGTRRSGGSRHRGFIYGETMIQLTEGSHEIEVMAENLRFERTRLIDQEVFNLANWIGRGTLPPEVGDVEFHIGTGSHFINSFEIVGLFYESGPILRAPDAPPPPPDVTPTATFTQEGSRYYLTIESGTGFADVELDFRYHENDNEPSVNSITIQTDGSPITFRKSAPVRTLSRWPFTGGSVRYTGRFRTGQRYEVTYQGAVSGAPVARVNPTTGNLCFFDTRGATPRDFGSDVRSALQKVNVLERPDPTPPPPARSERIQLDRRITKSVEFGRVYEVVVNNVGGRFRNGETAITPLRLRTGAAGGARGARVLRAEDWKDDDFTDIVCTASRGRFFDIRRNRAKFVVEGPRIGGRYSYGNLASGTVRDGVEYTGPRLSSYGGSTIGPTVTPTWRNNEDYRQRLMDHTLTMTWTNVDFPVTGPYTIQALADDVVRVRVDGQQVATARVGESVRTWNNVHLTQGRKTLELEVYNIPGNPTSTYWTNPTVAAVKIMTRVRVGTGITKPWTINPIGISAALYPPPCPKVIGGKGTVTEVRITQPGNGFSPPEGPGYPVLLELEDILITGDPFNYNCAEDTVSITTPSGNHGASAHICGCDNFGRITRICIDNGGQFTEYPLITINTKTGINFEGTPVFKVIRDPLPAPEPDKLVQVTDLVGLKQTGYYEGRPYYGAVFYKEGVRYAGMYETPGPLIQIYDTLQESIDAQVTTPPSAIQRQGTDISSNDPRLNIPGTPENLTDN